jgi:hypothetical protein
MRGGYMENFHKIVVSKREPTYMHVCVWPDFSIPESEYVKGEIRIFKIFKIL